MATRMNLKDIMVKETSQSQDKYYRIPIKDFKIIKLMKAESKGWLPRLGNGGKQGVSV